MKTWTSGDLALLTDLSLSNAEVAKRTGRSEAAIRGKRQRMAAASPPDARKNPPAPAPTTYEADQERAGNDYWKKQYQEQRAKYERALSENSAVERLVSIAKDLAPISYLPNPPVPKVSRGEGSPQSAVLLLSDCHIGQIITPEQTLGFGGYNFNIFLARLKFLEESIRSILRDHTNTPVPELVVALGGDLLDGALNHGAEAAQHSTLFTQFYAGSHALAQFLRNLAPLVPKIRVQTTVGNHPRFPSQKKMPTTNRFSNLDHFLAAHVQALTREIPSIEWSIDMQPFSVFDVQGFLFHLSHGDALKGGDRALGIPNHAVGRMVSSNAQLFGKTGQPSPQYFLLGHLHREIALPHARGSVIINGGFPGMDCYGLIGGFSPVDPSQTFFFVHPKYGKSASYSIQLKFAKTDGPRPYYIPENFPIS
jgi:hypothetical protein